ncbi:hypothetical protein NLJ89_g2219 [Agrocybe chaxingu]|uniref:Uncharacterized protein n=1 Tax=Agrocybe chaxingu TaxID=84603 RepID=A0A9W8K6A8_9AGAR|nr:hypothetical protein NLJ89_g2219 [Agrocybe chaxingu]
MQRVNAEAVLRQRGRAISCGVALVRSILQRTSFPNGFTTKQLFDIAVQEPPPKDFPPYPLSLPSAKDVQKPSKKAKNAFKPIAPLYPTFRADHPIRSIKFLKTEILPVLAGRQEIRMTHQPRTDLAPVPETPTKGKKKKKTSHMEFVWKPIPPENRWVPKPPPPKKEVVGTEVGVGADFSHLNKRRQRARVEKVSAAVMRMKEYRQQRGEELAW